MRTCRNLTLPSVSPRCGLNRAERIQVDADRVLRELCLLGFSNMADFMIAHEDGTAFLDFSNMYAGPSRSHSGVRGRRVHGWPRRRRRPVKRTKFKLADKKAALVDIGRHLGMFTDKLKVGGDENAPPVAAKLIIPWGDGSK